MKRAVFFFASALFLALAPAAPLDGAAGAARAIATASATRGPPATGAARQGPATAGAAVDHESTAATGAVFTLVPAELAAARLAPVDPGHRVAAWLEHAVAVIPAALLCVLFFAETRRRGVASRGALVATAVLAAATGVLYFARVPDGSALAALLLYVAVCMARALVRAADGDTGRGAHRGSDASPSAGSREISAAHADGRRAPSAAGGGEISSAAAGANRARAVAGGETVAAQEAVGDEIAAAYEAIHEISPRHEAIHGVSSGHEAIHEISPAPGTTRAIHEISPARAAISENAPAQSIHGTGNESAQASESGFYRGISATRESVSAGEISAWHKSVSGSEISTRESASSSEISPTRESLSGDEISSAFDSALIDEDPPARESDLADENAAAHESVSNASALEHQSAARASGAGATAAEESIRGGEIAAAYEAIRSDAAVATPLHRGDDGAPPRGLHARALGLGLALAALIVADGSLRLGALALAAWALGRARAWRRPLALALVLAPLALGGALAFALGGPALAGGDFAEGLFGLVLSTGKSVLLYNPPLLGALLAWPWWWRRHRRVAEPALLAALCLLVSVARLDDWAGDPTWGPRRLLPLVPLALEPLAPWLAALAGRARRRARGAVAVTVAAGVWVQALGLLWPPALYLGVAAEVRKATGAPRWFDLQPSQCHFIPQFSPLVGHAWLLSHRLRGDRRFDVAAPWQLLLPTSPPLERLWPQLEVDWWVRPAAARERATVGAVVAALALAGWIGLRRGARADAAAHARADDPPRG